MATQDGKLGELLVRDGVISRAQLNHALHVQKGQVQRERLGAILVGLDYVSRPKLRDAVRDYGKRELFGELLVHHGFISRESLDRALAAQEARGGALGAILLDMHALKEEDLAFALGEQLDVPYMVPQPYLVDMKVFNRLSDHFILGSYSIPVSEIRGVVTVLVSDPTNVNLKHTLESILGCEVQLAVGSESKIKGVIETLRLRKNVGSHEPSAAGRKGALSPSDRKLIIRSRDMRARQDGAGASDVLDYLVWDALKKRASDIHVEPQRDGIQVRYRIDGLLTDECDLSPAAAHSLFTRAKVLAGMDTSNVARPQAGRLLAEVDREELDLRLASFRTVLGETMAIRLFPKKTALLDFDELGMLPTVAAACRHAIERPCGLTLFVGPKGAGKTTSLYSTLQHFNDGATKIVTLESPVAFAMDGVAQNDVSRQPDADLRHLISSLLEHDPDIVALGEITDPRAAETLLRCAMTGHKVFSTMTAEDAAAALVQLGHAEGTTPFLSSCSIAVVAQRLVRKVCRHCREEYVPSAEIVRGFHVKDLDLDAIEFRRGRGCAECKGAGFTGRTGIFELLVVEPEIAALLHGKPSAHEIRSAVWKNPSFLSLGEAGFLKAIQGVTTLEEVRRVLSAPHDEHVPDNRRRTLDEICRVSAVKLDQVMSGEDDELADVEPQEAG